MPRLLCASLLLALALAGAPSLAAAEGAVRTATVEVEQIHASKAEGPADPRMAKFRAQLDDFAYRSYKLVSERKVTVALGASETVPLAGGKELKITFTKVDKDGRSRLRLSIKGVVETSVSLAAGGSVVLGGPALPHGDGALFVPVTLTK